MLAGWPLKVLSEGRHDLRILLSPWSDHVISEKFLVQLYRFLKLYLILVEMPSLLASWQEKPLVEDIHDQANLPVIIQKILKLYPNSLLLYLIQVEMLSLLAGWQERALAVDLLDPSQWNLPAIIRKFLVQARRILFL